MSYREFTWSKAKQDFGLQTIEGDRFFPVLPEVQPSSLLQAIGLGTIVGAGLGTIVGAGLGTQFKYPPIMEQQNPPSPPITEQQNPPLPTNNGTTKPALFTNNGTTKPVLINVNFLYILIEDTKILCTWCFT